MLGSIPGVGIIMSWYPPDLSLRYANTLRVAGLVENVWRELDAAKTELPCYSISLSRS
jgi:hypothetical protein